MRTNLIAGGVVPLAVVARTAEGVRHMHGLSLRCCLVLLAACFALGCTQTSHVALLSDGNLEGRRLEGMGNGPILTGEDCGMAYYLANAFRRAVKGTSYDTLLDVEVTSTAGITPFGQCLRVKGKGVQSTQIPLAEEGR